jgi:hypothetical protein
MWRALQRAAAGFRPQFLRHAEKKTDSPLPARRLVVCHLALHVHVLLRARQQVSRLLQWLKGSTARGANQLLAPTGQPFWQRESYDHSVRDETQLERIAAYIENNPVQAGLAPDPSPYRWSSAWQDGELKFAAAG